MKVLHVLNELRPSGAETMLRSAAPYWQVHGVTCEILATGKVEGVFAETLRAAGYRVHHLPRQNSIAYFMEFRRFVRRGGYSVVHQHAEGASYWFGLATLSAHAGLVRTVHSNFAFDGNLRWRRALQRRHLKALGARYVAIAPGVQQNEMVRFGIPSDLVWNWVDSKHFLPNRPEERATARARWGFDDGDIVLVSLGNCAPVKNHTAIIEALARTADLPQIRYLHAGQEDAEHSERKFAEKIGVSDRVVFCGWLPNVREALAAADLYVMPSLYEGFSIAALEALGAGLPALLAEVNGLRDLKLLFKGLIYAQPEAESIAQALRTFCQLDAHARSVIASEYPGLVEEKFDVKRGVREYCEIYKKISNARI